MSDQLAAIDEALDTGAADHSDPLTRELQELALALQADAPEPDAEFRRELGRKVRSGFPKPASLRRPLWRRALTPAFATALVAVPIVLIAVLASGSGDSGLDSSGGSSAGGGAADDSAPPRRRSSRPKPRPSGASSSGRPIRPPPAAAPPCPFRPTVVSRRASAAARSSARSGLSWRCRSTRWPAWPSR